MSRAGYLWATGRADDLAVLDDDTLAHIPTQTLYKRIWDDETQSYQWAQGGALPTGSQRAALSDLQSLRDYEWGQEAAKHLNTAPPSGAQGTDATRQGYQERLAEIAAQAEVDFADTTHSPIGDANRPWLLPDGTRLTDNEYQARFAAQLDQRSPVRRALAYTKLLAEAAHALWGGEGAHGTIESLLYTALRNRENLLDSDKFAAKQAELSAEVEGESWWKPGWGWVPFGEVQTRTDADGRRTLTPGPQNILPLAAGVADFIPGAGKVLGRGISLAGRVVWKGAKLPVRAFAEGVTPGSPADLIGAAVARGRRELPAWINQQLYGGPRPFPHPRNADTFLPGLQGSNFDRFSTGAIPDPVRPDRYTTRAKDLIRRDIAASEPYTPTFQYAPDSPVSPSEWAEMRLQREATGLPQGELLPIDTWHSQYGLYLKPPPGINLRTLPDDPPPSMVSLPGKDEPLPP